MQVVEKRVKEWGKASVPTSPDPAATPLVSTLRALNKGNGLSRKPSQASRCNALIHEVIDVTLHRTGWDWAPLGIESCSQLLPRL